MVEEQHLSGKDIIWSYLSAKSRGEQFFNSYIVLLSLNCNAQSNLSTLAEWQMNSAIWLVAQKDSDIGCQKNLSWFLPLNVYQFIFFQRYFCLYHS